MFTLRGAFAHRRVGEVRILGNHDFRGSLVHDSDAPNSFEGTRVDGGFVFNDGVGARHHRDAVSLGIHLLGHLLQVEPAPGFLAHVLHEHAPRADDVPGPDARDDDAKAGANRLNLGGHPQNLPRQRFGFLGCQIGLFVRVNAGSLLELGVQRLSECIPMGLRSGGLRSGVVGGCVSRFNLDGLVSLLIVIGYLRGFLRDDRGFLRLLDLPGATHGLLGTRSRLRSLLLRRHIDRSMRPQCPARADHWAKLGIASRNN